MLETVSQCDPLQEVRASSGAPVQTISSPESNVLFAAVSPSPGQRSHVIGKIAEGNVWLFMTNRR
jgi:hypothetical protein